ncbi:16S rRNA (cytosine(1402)-N(4))-methyltransferase RsmH [Dehalococcoidia bacterium]|nr:16S rRNA (cytosine(1402)-N(4))-methyltransferase RsmH [Dehalococcoidia bacterium]
MEQWHQPVMLKETVEALQVQPGGRYIDCTVGQGGHAAAILEWSSPGGQLLGLDADPQAIKTAQFTLREYGKSVLLINENFSRLEKVASEHNFRPVHGVLFDLGLSSLQLVDEERGFSFRRDGPLDMRFGPDQELTAAEIVNNFPEDELARLIWSYGEERRSRRIARCIVESRPVKTTLELAGIVAKAVNGERGRIHPATRTFQALRIAVNREMENLVLALEQAVNLLGFGGRLVVISFHSLEDRPVKELLSRETRRCICPPETPVCTCRHTPRLRLVSKGIIRPTSEEIEANPRSRSAKLRVAERIGQV